MNVEKYVTDGKLTRVNERDETEKKWFSEKNALKNSIVKDYQDLFVLNFPEYDIEFAHYENDATIGQIADFYQTKLEKYFDVRPSHLSAYRKVKQILIANGVFVVTRYTKTKPVFDLTSFIADYTNLEIEKVLSFIPSKRKKFLALMEWLNAVNDFDVLRQLNILHDKGCKLI